MPQGPSLGLAGGRPWAEGGMAAGQPPFLSLLLSKEGWWHLPGRMWNTPGAEGTGPHGLSKLRVRAALTGVASLILKPFLSPQGC